MRIRSLMAATAIALVASAAAISAGAAELVTNGGFEDGFTGWDNHSGDWFLSTNIDGPAQQGVQYASTGCVEHYCTLEQNISTVAGATYDFSFIFNPGAGVLGSGANTLVYFGNTLVANIGLGAQAWSTYNFTGLTATSDTTNIRFTAYQNPAWNAVDAVSVVGSLGGVPEPATWGLMLTGFLGAGVAIRSNRRRQAALAA